MGPATCARTRVVSGCVAVQRAEIAPRTQTRASWAGSEGAEIYAKTEPTM